LPSRLTEKTLPHRRTQSQECEVSVKNRQDNSRNS
jgi:hypothetical protein